MIIELWDGPDKVIRGTAPDALEPPKILAYRGEFYALKRYPEYHKTPVNYLIQCHTCNKPWGRTDNDGSDCPSCEEEKQKAKK